MKRQPVVVRFTDPDDIVWTVWDTTFTKGKHHRRPHADPTATARIFVNAGGVKRVYKFKPSDTRVLEPQALERQLRGAEYLGERYDTSERQPR